MKARKISAIMLSAGLLVSLTACGDSLEDVQKKSEIAKTCMEGGGKIRYNMIGDMFCMWKEN